VAGNGLYLGNSGLSFGTGLYQNNTSLWSGSPGLQAGSSTTENDRVTQDGSIRVTIAGDNRVWE